MATLRFISDAGHGWLEVSEAAVTDAGVRGEISPFSFLNPKTGMMYLEEDEDMPLFTNAVRHTLKIREIHSRRDAFVRNLPRVAA